jgi:hypothetical protein
VSGRLFSSLEVLIDYRERSLYYSALFSLLNKM